MEPHYANGIVTLYGGDCLAVLPDLPDASIDAIATDPPYALDLMGNAWDRFTAFEFERWVERWAGECLRVLKPGGHMLAFGGSRTWHRLAAGIEDAGFEIRDSIAWLYAQGFPKSLDVSAAVDKLDAAEERQERARTFQAWLRQYMTPQRVNELTNTDMGHHLTTHPTQPSVATAAIFDLLRPHLPEVPDEIEELVRIRTVESQNYAAREVTGQHEQPAAAATWRANYQDAGVPEAAERRDRGFTEEAQKWEGWGTALKPAFEPIVVARRPLVGTVAANVVAFGTGGLNIDATRVGEAVESWPSSRRQYRVSGIQPGGGKDGQTVETGESPSGRWPTNVILDPHTAADLDRQAPRAGAAAPASGPTRAGSSSSVARGQYAGTDDAPAFYGDQGGASRMFPVFKYEPKAPTSERPRVDGEAHPTVKPLDLMRWIVRLVTPPGGVVLDPFAGSGTTGEACMVEGFTSILIEREPKYLPLILERFRKDIQPTMFGEDLA